MSTIAPALSLRSLGLLLVAAVPVILVSVFGSLFTFQGLVSWYPTLRKPFFTPPNGVFPIAWTFLYTLMVLSLWRVLRSDIPGKGRALATFGVQLALNLAWSFVFFGLRSPWGGVGVITALIIAILLTIRAFRPFDTAAAYALVPYLAWVSFAALLNVSIAVLN
jgi:benzodiazapine receptor